MEDWQQWQIRADQIAVSLGAEVDGLTTDFFGDAGDATMRGFWPRFRDLKERVRTAPAIRLEAKLDLERRLRSLGSRAYKAQEVVYAHSSERKTQLLDSIEEVRISAESVSAPRDLRGIRRSLDTIRQQFDSGVQLVPPDRQVVWDAWRGANQFVWQKLTDSWAENETQLRELIAEARRHVENGESPAAKQAVARFFEALRTRECKQEIMTALKSEAELIRREADQSESRKVAERVVSQQAQVVPAVDSWRSELERNRESIARLQEEITVLDYQFQSSASILEQAMVRGSLVDKKRKLAEYERSAKALLRRIEQSEEAPVFSMS